MKARTARAKREGSNMAKAATLSTVLLSFALALLLYPLMPERMASHWNAAGDVNGYMPREWGLFLMPALSILLFLLFLAIPRIDPLKANVAQFRGYFDGFVLAIEAFLLYIYVLTLAWSFGCRFNMVQMMAIPFGALFFCAGILIGHAKRNWFIGIRTPWTLSSERVWNDTHRLGAKLFKASGVIACFGAAFPDYARWLLLAPVVSAAAVSAAYSYFDFKKRQ